MFRQNIKVSSTRLPVLDLLRVIAMFFVMLMHSPVTGDPKDKPAVFFLKSFIASGAVPLFFLLSGYLGARKINDRGVSIGCYAKEKLHTLVIPFLFWNALVLSLVFLAKAIGLDSVSRSSGAYFDVEPTVSSIASALLGIGRPPIVYQFWFLRDLIVVTLVSFVICRYIPRIPLLPWLLFFIPIPMASSMGYFLLGYTIQPYFSTSQYFVGQSLGSYCIAWILLGCGTIVMWTSIPFPLQQIGSTTFILFLSLLLSRFALGQRLAVLGSSTFLVYAIHEPMQTFIAKIWLAHGWPLYGSLFSFLLIPIVVLPLCILAYYFIRRLLPWLLPYVTGGR